MSSNHRVVDLPRRRFLVQGSALAAGSALALGAGTRAARGQGPAALDPFWQDERVDATWTRHGHVRVAIVDQEKRPTAVPLGFWSAGGASMVDWRSGRPVVRIGDPRKGVQFTHAGIRVGGREEKWSKAGVTALLQALTRDRELARAAIGLRGAMLAAYPEYLHRRRVGAPAKVAARMAKSGRAMAAFGRKKSQDACHLEQRIDSVTHEVTREVDVVLSAAQQLDQCLKACEDTYGKDILKAPEKLLCQTECLGEAFVDLVVGTTEVVDTVVEEVVTSVEVCTESIAKGRFPNPILGGFDMPTLAGAAPVGNPKLSGDVLTKALKVVRDLSSRLPPVVNCLLQGNWSITNLEDIGVPNAHAVPVGVTVCLDRDCATALETAGTGGDPVTLVATLVSLADAIPAAVQALALAAGVAAVVTQAALAIVALILILFIHLEIVVGQIFVYDQLHMDAGGVCITHPSMPILAIGVVNPILGMLALGNTPLIVTPA